MPLDQEGGGKRSSPRYKARIAVFLGQDQKDLLTDYAINISTGGLFLETVNPLPVDTEIVVKFKLPDSDNIIVANARVAWTNDPAALKKPSLPPGMGLQFIDLSLDDLHAIRAYLDKGELVPTW